MNLGEFVPGDTLHYGEIFYNSLGELETPGNAYAKIWTPAGAWVDLNAPTELNDSAGFLGGTIDTTGFFSGEYMLEFGGDMSTDGQAKQVYYFTIIAYNEQALMDALEALAENESNIINLISILADQQEIGMGTCAVTAEVRVGDQLSIGHEINIYKSDKAPFLTAVTGGLGTAVVHLDPGIYYFQIRKPNSWTKTFPVTVPDELAENIELQTDTSDKPEFTTYRITKLNPIDEQWYVGENKEMGFRVISNHMSVLPQLLPLVTGVTISITNPAGEAGAATATILDNTFNFFFNPAVAGNHKILLTVEIGQAIIKDEVSVLVKQLT